MVGDFYHAGRLILRISQIAVLLLLFASLASTAPNAYAQATSITDLRHPTSAEAGNSEPISLTATVSYRDAKPSYLLVVGILSTGAPSKIIPGIATSSPDRCVNQPILAAFCVIKISNASGAEHVEFKIGGILGDPQGEGPWNLNMTAALATSNNTIVANSRSSILFSITISPMILTVKVPANVSVSVDGATQPPGPVQVPVSAGSHNMTLPTIVQVNDTVRLRFDSWADGFAVPNRTVKLSASGTYEAVYVTQYRLSIVGQATSATGQGWYDPGSSVTISVADTEPMAGILGLLGGKLRFQAWYEDGKFLTNSSIDMISMGKPHALTVLWQADYTMPLVTVMIIAVVLISIYYLIHRRTRATTPRLVP